MARAKAALANAIYNNARLKRPAVVAPATGTATEQDSDIMRKTYVDREAGGADPVEGRTQYGTTQNENVQYRSAGNLQQGAAGQETVYKKFGPFRDTGNPGPPKTTFVIIYNDPGK